MQTSNTVCWMQYSNAFFKMLPQNASTKCLFQNASTKCLFQNPFTKCLFQNDFHQKPSSKCRHLNFVLPIIDSKCSWQIESCEVGYNFNGKCRIRNFFEPKKVLIDVVSRYCNNICNITLLKWWSRPPGLRLSNFSCKQH